MNGYFILLSCSALAVFSSSICLLFSLYDEDSLPVNVLTGITIVGAISSIILLAAVIKLDKNTPIKLKSDNVKTYNVTTDLMPEVPMQTEEV